MGHDADAFAVEALFDIGDAKSAPSDADSDGVDSGNTGSHGDFGLLARVACYRDDFDQALGDFRHAIA
ncbi:hypothetical protein O982_23845 [Mycobacterium avium 10-5581]|nr:hypothetical protein O982_23845 [Mycobacterium avium 10-5581]